MRELWASGRVVPGPVQDAVPWWGGFFGPRGVRLAGRLGMGLLAAVPELVPAYLAGLEEGGHPVSSARYAQPWNIVLADDPDAGVAADLRAPRVRVGLVRPVHGRRAPTNRCHRPSIRSRCAQSVPGWGASGAFFMVLTPAQAADFLRGVVERMPLEETFFWTSIVGMPEDLEERHVELVCTELRPLVADLGP